LKRLLIYRKKDNCFNSIENVFDRLVVNLRADKIELPYESRGILPRLKNIAYVTQFRKHLKHITGHDHYLLWWPFKKTVLTIHDIEALKRKTGIKKWLFQKLWYDWPIGNASVITTISEFSKKELLSINNYKTPIVVVPNPVTLPLVYTPKVFNTAFPRILHVGIKSNKNLYRLIRALSGLRCELIIVGEATQELEKELHKYQITYEFKTGLSNEEVMQEYVLCDLVAFVSTYEGFGLPILEAQAVGRPVITSNVASMPEVAGKGALFVDPFSVESIKEGILKVITNEVFRNNLIAEGGKNIKKFDVSRIAEMYLKVYSALSE